MAHYDYYCVGPHIKSPRFRILYVRTHRRIKQPDPSSSKYIKELETGNIRLSRFRTRVPLFFAFRLCQSQTYLQRRLLGSNCENGRDQTITLDMRPFRRILFDRVSIVLLKHSSCEWVLLSSLCRDVFLSFYLFFCLFCFSFFF